MQKTRENKINHHSRDMPQDHQPITHRRGWSKVREQAGEKAGALCVLLKESNKECEEYMDGPPSTTFSYQFSGEHLSAFNDESFKG